MRFAYADPPYPGCAHRYPEKQEVDHRALIEMLCREFPDGWTLSTHQVGLRMIPPLLPPHPRARVCAWVKASATGIPGHRVMWSWEPLVLCGGRQRISSIRDSGPLPLQGTRDSIYTTRMPGSGNGGILGSKPERFCWWVFELLGARPGDELVDLFPGTGGVMRAWDVYLKQLKLFM